jgi:hypothetical protein
LRCNVIAHKNAKEVALGNNYHGGSSLTYGDIDVLLTRALEILNRYSMLFKVTEYTAGMREEDDYLIVLQRMREAGAHRLSGNVAHTPAPPGNSGIGRTNTAPDAGKP